MYGTITLWGAAFQQLPLTNNFVTFLVYIRRFCLTTPAVSHEVRYGNSNIQTPNSRQCPISKARNVQTKRLRFGLEILNLRFVWDLEIVIWLFRITFLVIRPVWASPRSLAATDGILIGFYSSWYWNVLLPRVRAASYAEFLIYLIILISNKWHSYVIPAQAGNQFFWIPAFAGTTIK